jgi:hypothetical protein
LEEEAFEAERVFLALNRRKLVARRDKHNLARFFVPNLPNGQTLEYVGRLIVLVVLLAVHAAIERDARTNTRIERNDLFAR